MEKNSKEKNSIEDIDVIRKEEGVIHIIGHNERSDSPKVNKYYHIVVDAKSTKLLAEDIFRYKSALGLEASQFFSYVGIGIPFLIYHKTGDRDERREKSEDIINKIQKYTKKNIAEYTEQIKNIAIYQSSIDETSKLIGADLILVDTKSAEKFIQAKDSFWLRVKANDLGADAVVMYNPTSICGTPVKIKNREQK